MQNLLPRSAYDADEVGVWKRMPVVGGLLTFLLGSILFGLIFPFSFKWLFALLLGETVSFPLFQGRPGLRSVFRTLVRRHLRADVSGEGAEAAEGCH